jgi:hypothetical protein
MMSSAKCVLIFVRHGFTIGLSHIGMHYENFDALIFGEKEGNDRA